MVATIPLPLPSQTGTPTESPSPTVTDTPTATTTPVETIGPLPPATPPPSPPGETLNYCEGCADVTGDGYAYVNPGGDTGIPDSNTNTGEDIDEDDNDQIVDAGSVQPDPAPPSSDKLGFPEFLKLVSMVEDGFYASNTNAAASACFDQLWDMYSNFAWLTNVPDYAKPGILGQFNMKGWLAPINTGNPPIPNIPTVSQLKTIINFQALIATNEGNCSDSAMYQMLEYFDTATILRDPVGNYLRAASGYMRSDAGLTRFLNQMIDNPGARMSSVLLVALIDRFTPAFHVPLVRFNNLTSPPWSNFVIPPGFDLFTALLANKLTPSLEQNAYVASQLNATLNFNGDSWTDYTGSFIHNHPFWASLVTFGVKDMVLHGDEIFYGKDVYGKDISRARTAAMLMVESALFAVGLEGTVTAAYQGVRWTSSAIVRSAQFATEAIPSVAQFARLSKLYSGLRRGVVDPIHAMAYTKQVLTQVTQDVRGVALNLKMTLHSELTGPSLRAGIKSINLRVQQMFVNGSRRFFSLFEASELEPGIANVEFTVIDSIKAPLPDVPGTYYFSPGHGEAGTTMVSIVADRKQVLNAATGAFDSVGYVVNTDAKDILRYIKQVAPGIPQQYDTLFYANCLSGVAGPAGEAAAAAEAATLMGMKTIGVNGLLSVSKTINASGQTVLGIVVKDGASGWNVGQDWAFSLFQPGQKVGTRLTFDQFRSIAFKQNVLVKYGL